MRAALARMTTPALYLTVIGGLQLGLLWLLRERFGTWVPAVGGALFIGLLVALIRTPGAWALKLAVLYSLVAVTTAAPMIESMITRSQVGLTIEHDGLIQTEAAVDRVLAGERIYGVDWSKTDLARFPWTTTSGRNPALSHFVYYPLLVLLGIPLRLASRAAGLHFDYRAVLLAFLGLGLWVVHALPMSGPRRFMIAVALFLNPLISTYLWTGRNDMAFVVMVLMGLMWLAKDRPVLASLALGIGLALKPFALFAVPFLALTLWRRWQGRMDEAGEAGRCLLALAGPALFTILPFLLLDPGAFIRDTVLYAGGGVPDAYPIGGDGFGAILLATHLIGRNTDAFPFWIFQLVGLAPVLWFGGRAFVRRPKAGRWMAGFAGLLLAFMFFSRFFNDNYIAVILAFFLTVPPLAVLPIGRPATALRHAPGTSVAA